MKKTAAASLIITLSVFGLFLTGCGKTASEVIASAEREKPAVTMEEKKPDAAAASENEQSTENAAQIAEEPTQPAEDMVQIAEKPEQTAPAATDAAEEKQPAPDAVQPANEPETVTADPEQGSAEPADDPSEEETIPEYLCYVNAPDGYVNLRTGPGTEYDIICPIPNGESLERYREEGTAKNGKRWLKVAYWYDGDWRTGWVIASQIDE